LYNWLYEHSRLYNYANEPSQAALDVIRLTRSKAAAWTTAEVDDVARMVEFLKLKTTIFIYLLIFTVGNI